MKIASVIDGSTLYEAEAQDWKELVEKAVEADANLQDAKLQWANLQDAKLQGAKLQWANLQGANVDMAVWPLWCGSLDAKIDDRIFRQLVFHAARAGKEIEDPAIKRLLKLKSFRDVCAKFHRFDEVGGFEGKKS